MAAITPRVRWGSREVDWTYVPETAGEIAATARRLVAEATGTLAFTFVAASAVVVNSFTDGELGLLGMAAAIAVGYALLVAFFHPISGGHLNPAVTVGLVAARRMPLSIGLFYIAAQFGGAVVGALLLNVVYDDFIDDAAASAVLAFDSGMSAWIAALVEAVLTFVLVVFYFRAYVDPRGDRTMGGLALGMVILFSFLIAFPLTGAALNLARVFGADLVAGEWTDFWYYWLGLAGGLVAGFSYEYLFAKPEEES